MSTNVQAGSKKIVIIGAGIIGSTTAYFLTRHPNFNPATHTITLLEATSIASGASGKAGGLLALWAYPKAIVPLSFNLHRQLADEHNGKDRWGYRGVGVGAVELKGRRIAAGSIKVANPAQFEHRDHSENFKGVHDPAVAADGNVSLKKRSKDSIETARKAGLPGDLDWISEESLVGYESMGTTENTAQVHPYQFTTAMANMAEEKGVRIIYGKAEALRVEHGRVKSVRYKERDSGTEQMITDVTDVVVTAGPWSGTVWPAAPISATRAHSVTIRPSRPVSAYALFTQIELPKNFKEGVHSSANYVSPEIYARPNNELYACGVGDHLIPLPETSADVKVDEARCQDIIDYCASFSDEMRDGEVLMKQACYLPDVETGRGPLIGPTGVKGVWIATGHTCWGIQNGPATGKLMAEFIFEGQAKSANLSGLDPRKSMR